MGGRPVSAGLLISLEGLDGVGKTTQIERLASWVRDGHGEVKAVREPGGTAFGEALRDLVLHRIEAQSALAEFLVFAAARAELMQTVVLPALSQGAIVLMDRFIDSSVAYQAFGHGLDADTVVAINHIVTQGRKPNLTVWLHGQPFATEDRDRMEQRNPAYFARVAAGYAWLVEQEPERFLVVDSGQNPDIIFDTLRTRIHRLLNRNKRGGEG